MAESRGGTLNEPELNEQAKEEEMKVRNVMEAQGLRTTYLVRKSGLSGFTINHAVNHNGMSSTTRKILARVMGVSPRKLGATTLQDRGISQPVQSTGREIRGEQPFAKDGHKYDMKTKNAIVEIARNSRLAGKSWREVLEEAKKVGYAGSLQGVEKMAGRLIGKVRKSKIGKKGIKSIAIRAVGSDVGVGSGGNGQVQKNTIENAVVNALYSTRGQEGFSRQEAQMAIDWAKNILQERDNLQRIMEGKAKINVENGAVQVITG